MPKNHDLVEIECTVVHQTEMAWLLESHDTGEQAWVPKSQCEVTASGAGATVELSERLAVEKELA